MSELSVQRHAELEEEFYEEWHPGQGTNMLDMLVHKIIGLETENGRLKEWTEIESSYAHMFLVWMRLVKEHSEELYWELFDRACGHFDAILLSKS